MSEIDYNRLNGPQRRVLRAVLIDVFRRTKTLDMFLQDNGYDPLGDIVEPGPFKHVVFDLIDEFGRLGRLDNLLADARSDYPENPDLIELDQRLTLVDEEAEQQRVVGQRGLERMVRDAGFKDLALWAHGLLAAGRKVCRISYPLSGDLVRGTGFLVAPDLILTNYHVVEPLIQNRADPAMLRLNFGFVETEDGPVGGERCGVAREWLMARAPHSEADLAPDAGLPKPEELDFALVRLDGAAGETQTPLGRRGWFDLGASLDLPVEGAIVFVLQHPEGKTLKQSIGVVQAATTPLRLRYDADTDHGSSGGLVLDQKLAPIALHHAGDPDSKIKARYNQGIPLALIREALVTGSGVAPFWTG